MATSRCTSAKCLEKEGKFPRRVGSNRVAWLESEVEAWVAARVAERDAVVR
jgi:prophage regulatory protein